MAKNIIKEIIIVLLLILAIILIMGVLLYEYVPSNKIIPQKISYTTPENVKSELQTDASVDETEIVVTYQVDSTDIKNYKKVKEYVPGRTNPFASIENTSEESKTESGNEQGTTTSVNNNATENQSGTQTSGTSNNENTTSNTGYVPDKGTK